MYERITKLCDAMLAAGVPGCDLMIMQRGRLIYRYWNGVSDVENNVPMNGKERYNIYSCSKIMTCTAAMQLWEKGAFSLEDRLSDYLPEFAEMTVKTENGLRPAVNQIRIHHLFEMAAGLNYDLKSPSLMRCREETGGRCPTREAMKYLAREPLEFEPGSRYLYSLCHDVLAALVEVLYGEKFEDYVKKHIFDAAGLTRSTFLLPENEAESVAPQYDYAEGRFVPAGKGNVYRIGSEYASGGAGCVSTVEDYILFLEALRTGMLLKPETLKLMATDRLSPVQRVDYAKDDYGYGLGMRCGRGDPRFTDFGWGGAAGAFLAIDPEWDISLYFAMSVFSFPGRAFRAMLPWTVRTELCDSASDWEKIKWELAARSDGLLTVRD